MIGFAHRSERHAIQLWLPRSLLAVAFGSGSAPARVAAPPAPCAPSFAGAAPPPRRPGEAPIRKVRFWWQRR